MCLTAGLALASSRGRVVVGRRSADSDHMAFVLSKPDSQADDADSEAQPERANGRQRG